MVVSSTLWQTPVVYGFLFIYLNCQEVHTIELHKSLNEEPPTDEQDKCVLMDLLMKKDV